MKVLIADDHAVVRKGLIQIISELPGGVDVEEACCGKDVVQKTQKRLFDVVVLDISCRTEAVWISLRISRA